MSYSPRWLAVLAAGLLLTTQAGSASAAMKLYVAPNGSDAWSGTLRAPNRTKTDGPFASLRIDPRKHRRFEFNLTVRKSAEPVWLMWQGTGGHSWRVDRAGSIELE